MAEIGGRRGEEGKGREERGREGRRGEGWRRREERGTKGRKERGE